MGRGAAGALQAAVLLIEHTNRALFYRDGALVAFPALDLLALLAGVNEKTIRRSINKLEGAGLVRIQHRRNDSNLYYLTIPPEAETHLFECDAAIIKRRKTGRSGAPKCPPDRTDGNRANTKCPTTSDYTSDLHSISKRHPSDAEEKRLGEKKRDGTSFLGHLFRETRELGPEGPSVIAKAMKDWGRDADDVRDVIEAVRDYGGDARDLAHDLWEPDL
jgi:DNA-binding MarR family transcriptional regulator